MKTYEIVLFGANFANSLFIAFVLGYMFIREPHEVMLIEPNSAIITGEAIASICIVTLTILLGVSKLRTDAAKKA
jgi:hypothetical protein